MIKTKAEKVKNSSSHAEFIAASTPNIMMLNKEEILNQVQDDNRRGFTLIELLVVVLIIGILAAVAVPQYQKAVLKSRYAQLKQTAHQIEKAAEIYYLENGTYPNTFSDLVLNMDGQESVYRDDGVFVLNRNFDNGVNCQLFRRDGSYAFVSCYDTQIKLGYDIEFSNSVRGRFRECFDISEDATSMQHQICVAETGTDTYVADGDGVITFHVFRYQQ